MKSPKSISPLLFFDTTGVPLMGPPVKVEKAFLSVMKEYKAKFAGKSEETLSPAETLRKSALIGKIQGYVGVYQAKGWYVSEQIANCGLRELLASDSVDSDVIQTHTQETTSGLGTPVTEGWVDKTILMINMRAEYAYAKMQSIYDATGKLVNVWYGRDSQGRLKVVTKMKNGATHVWVFITSLWDRLVKGCKTVAEQVNSLMHDIINYYRQPSAA